jgi:hypothetical protein
VFIGGDDLKSGQTKMKSVLVDFLVSAGPYLCFLLSALCSLLSALCLPCVICFLLTKMKSVLVDFLVSAGTQHFL